jgi:short-subunit dehydrogenase
MTVISSIAGLIGFRYDRVIRIETRHYGYLETLQCELYKTNITVSIVYPGRIDTNISKNAHWVMVSNLARRMRTMKLA